MTVRSYTAVMFYSYTVFWSKVIEELFDISIKQHGVVSFIVSDVKCDVLSYFCYLEAMLLAFLIMKQQHNWHFFGIHLYVYECY